MTDSNSAPSLSWLKTLLIIVVAAMLSALLAVRWAQHQQPKIETMTGAGVLQRIQQLHHLQTVAYHVDTVVTSNKEGSWGMLWQDSQKGLFMVSGRVVAGVDLAKLTAQQVVVSPDGKNITIQLPPVEILSNSLDKIEVYDIETGLFGLMDMDPKIFSAAQTAGKQKILSSACQSGILKIASDNAQKQLTALFTLTQGQNQTQVTVRAAAIPACR